MVALFERVTRGIRSRLLFLKSEERGSITVALQYEQFWAKELIHNPGLRWIGSRFKFAIELWNCNSAFFLEKNIFPRRAREKIKLYAEVELAVCLQHCDVSTYFNPGVTVENLTHGGHRHSQFVTDFLFTFCTPVPGGNVFFGCTVFKA